MNTVRSQVILKVNILLTDKIYPVVKVWGFTAGIFVFYLQKTCLPIAVITGLECIKLLFVLEGL